MRKILVIVGLMLCSQVKAFGQLEATHDPAAGMPANTNGVVYEPEAPPQPQQNSNPTIKADAARQKSVGANDTAFKQDGIKSDVPNKTSTAGSNSGLP